MSEILTKSAQETQKIGRILAKELLKTKTKQALVVGLEGDLGGGKTTFVQGLAQGLGIRQDITSPSFVIMKKFKIPKTHRISQFPNFPISNFYHIDCYRLNKPQELLELDFDQIIKNLKNLVVIEWAEKVEEILPEERIKIKFEWISENKRRITMNSEQ